MVDLGFRDKVNFEFRDQGYGGFRIQRLEVWSIQDLEITGMVTILEVWGLVIFFSFVFQIASDKYIK